MVWWDDFDYEGAPNPAKWNYDLGNHQWPNQELQAYTDRPGNVAVHDGRLVIRALKEQDGERGYTSARLTTFGRQTWKYGYFEIRAKLPRGGGSWPALWFLAEDIRRGVKWPLCGEIDMLEHSGQHEGELFYSLHSQKHNHTLKNAVQYTTTIQREKICDDFHIFGMEWTPEHVEYFLDGKSVCIYGKGDDREDQTEAAWPFDKPYYLILNIAVGGAGRPGGGGSTAFCDGSGLCEGLSDYS